MKPYLSHLTLSLAAALIGLGAGAPARADDTEIFFTAKKPVPDNILFVLDTSGSMNWHPTNNEDPEPSSNRRIEIMKDALSEVVQQASNVNIGLMRFTAGDGGAVMAPIRHIDASGADNGVVTLNGVIRSGDDDVIETNKTLDTSSEQLVMSAGTTLGLRYQGINIPRGAKITEAHLEFQHFGQNTANTKYHIYGDKSGDSAPFASSLPSARTSTSNTLNWAITENWNNGGGYRSPDLSALIEEIVGQSGWCGGNALTLLLQHTRGGSRSPTAYENSTRIGLNNYTGLAPILTVKYDEAATASNTSNSCRIGHTAGKVEQNSDNLEEASNGTVRAADGSLELYQINPTTSNAAVGLRFAKLNVPQGAVLSKAEILLSAANARNSATTGTAYALAVDNAPVFGTANQQLSNTTTSPRTVGSAFSIPQATSNNAGKEARLDVTAALQAVINRGGWVSGNSTAFVLTGTSGNYAASAADNPSTAPRLLVRFQQTGKAYQAGDFTVREAVQNSLNAMTAEGPTPSTEALYEAYQYLVGGKVDFGKSRGGAFTTRVSVASSYSGGTVSRWKDCPDSNSNHPQCVYEKINDDPRYISPIRDDGSGSAQCQKSNVVFLSDGEPNQNSGMAARINAITKDRCIDSDDGQDCAYALAEHLNTTADLSSTITGQQTAKLHTIALSLSGNANGTHYMKQLAQHGGGTAFAASSKAELVHAFSTITASSESGAGHFVTSAPTVDLSSGLSHSNELYVPLFKPSTNIAWLGNLKRYERKTDGLVYGANNVAALDAGTGGFNSATRSFWSSAVDGNFIEQGGAAEQLGNNRVIYSNIAANAALTNASNTVNNGNSQLTEALLGAQNATERTDIIKWAQGDDGTGTPRKLMNDILHSTPVVLAYGRGQGQVPDKRVFVGDNAGFLHAIDTSNGQEQWSFLPKELLGNLKLIRQGDTNGAHIYGLDGQITIKLLSDANKNGIVDNGDKAMLYVGMRRGGRNYYALDISDPALPKLAFSILGGTGSNANPATDYSSLGQSWAKPVFSTLRLNGQIKQVLVLAGGYDPNQDGYGGHTADTMGNTVYVLDAQTGEVIWDAKKQMTNLAAKLTNSIPADVAVVDLTGSGHAEHLYVADTAGQIFRFDVNPAATDASDLMLASSGRIAHLQDSTAEVDNRRFYYAPSVAYIKRPRGRSFVAVSVGSGYREHPLDQKIEEHLYSLRDYGVNNPTGPIIDKDIELADLIDINQYKGDKGSVADDGTVSTGSNGISDAVDALEFKNSTRKGWYLPFHSQDSAIKKSGEKVLSGSTVYRNKLLVTSYYPENSSNACSTSIGRSRLYILDIVGGDTTTFIPVINDPATTDIDQRDRFIDQGSGIAGSPYATLDSNGNVRVVSGLNPGINMGKSRRINSYMWKQEE